MKEGKMLPPGAGRLIAGGALHATLKVSGGARGDGAVCSTFEIIVPPGYDVGAHGKPDPKAVTELRLRHDIQQLTRLVAGAPPQEAT